MPRKPLELPPVVVRAFVMDMRAFHAASTGFEKNEMAPVSCATRAPTAGREETAASRRAQDVLGDEGSRDLMTDDLKSEKIIVMEFGRQKVFDPVGRCIYCNANDCDLGDEHIIPQALAGNMILPAACCRDCEQIVGAKLEGRLLHKTQGMFAAMRLRLEYKSRRPKDRPKSLPYTVIGTDGIPRTVKVPAKKVPRHWMAIVTETSSGIIIGRDRRESARAAVYAMYDPNDFAAIGRPGEQVQFQGANDMRDFARFLCKIAHAITVAEYGLDAFEPWLPNFILGKDDCTLHYYFAGHENKTVDNNGDHSVSLGTWANDGVRIGVRVRLFCRYGTPDYEIAVGKFKKPS